MTIPDWLRLRTAPGGARQPTGEVFLPLTAQQALEARREALALMGPYLAPSGFHFRGVPG